MPRRDPRGQDRRFDRRQARGLRAVVPALWIFLACTVAEPASAADSAPEDAVSAARLLGAAIGGITGLVAEFTQTLESPALPAPQIERGTVYLLRPGCMRWEYSDPDGKLAIAAGGRTLLYLPEEGQLVRSRLGTGGQESGIELLLRERLDLVSEFGVDWGPRPGRGGPRPLKLTPRSPEASYRYLLIEIGPDRMLTSLAVVDALGSTVTYRFTRVRRVASLDAGLFSFTPPEGVEIRDVDP